MSRPELARRLGTADAVTIGLGSMVGAGVFVTFAPAAQAAGSWLLLGLAIAAIVAFCNAVSTAQLAAAHPTSGGVYVYGREELGEWWGYLAGWGFLIGKTASCAAMALAFAAYAVPPAWERPAAVAAVLALGSVNLAGITRTARLTRVIVLVVLGCLSVAVLAAWVGGDPSIDALRPETDAAVPWYGVLQAAGLLFFAFAGYARIATLGEEVIDPERTITTAIRRALLLVVLVYAVVAVTLLAVLGAEGLADAPDPVAAAVGAGTWTWAGTVVRIGAAAASLGALLALMTGIGRTGLAMARHGDLPIWLAAVDARRQVPRRAELVLMAVLCVLVSTTDLRGAIGFSSFGVLVYYLVANVAAWTQRPPRRRTPRVLQVVGAAGCLVLALAVRWQSLAVGVGVLAIGVLLRAARRQVWWT